MLRGCDDMERSVGAQLQRERVGGRRRSAGWPGWVPGGQRVVGVGLDGSAGALTRRLSALGIVGGPVSAEPDGGPATGGAQVEWSRRALADGEFRVQFQPVVALSTAAVVGFEALLRWEHPDRGLLRPVDFLAAHPAGLATEVGEAVLAAAVGVLAELRRVRGARPEVDPPALTVAVNVGSDQFRGPGLAACLLGLLAAHHLPGSAVTVEVTETTVIADMAVAATELGRLRTAGVGVCLDDYGSGTSGLHRLLQLPFSSLKLDHRLTGGLGADPRVGAVAASTAALAADLGLHLTAGGGGDRGAVSAAARRRLHPRPGLAVRTPRPSRANARAAHRPAGTSSGLASLPGPALTSPSVRVYDPR